MSVAVAGSAVQGTVVNKATLPTTIKTYKKRATHGFGHGASKAIKAILPAQKCIWFLPSSFQALIGISFSTFPGPPY